MHLFSSRSSETLFKNISYDPLLVLLGEDMQLVLFFHPYYTLTLKVFKSVLEKSYLCLRDFFKRVNVKFENNIYR